MLSFNSTTVCVASLFLICKPNLSFWRAFRGIHIVQLQTCSCPKAAEWIHNKVIYDIGLQVRATQLGTGALGEVLCRMVISGTGDPRSRCTVWPSLETPGSQTARWSVRSTKTRHCHSWLMIYGFKDRDMNDPMHDNDPKNLNWCRPKAKGMLCYTI